METLLLVINIILAVILVLLVLLQKSEGGALGIGVSQENFMLSRSAGSFMTKATAIVATLFIICSLALTIISRAELTPTGSVLDTVEEKTEDTPSIPENNYLNLFNSFFIRYKILPWRDIYLSLAAWFLLLVKVSLQHL